MIIYICMLIALGVYIGHMNASNSKFESFLLAVTWPIMVGCLIHDEVSKRS